MGAYRCVRECASACTRVGPHSLTGLVFVCLFFAPISILILLLCELGPIKEINLWTIFRQVIQAWEGTRQQSK